MLSVSLKSIVKSIGTGLQELLYGSSSVPGMPAHIAPFPSAVPGTPPHVDGSPRHVAPFPVHPAYPAFPGVIPDVAVLAFQFAFLAEQNNMEKIIIKYKIYKCISKLHR